MKLSFPKRNNIDIGKAGVGAKGRFDIEVIDKHGNIKEKLGWDNLLMNYFFEYVLNGTYLYVTNRDTTGDNQYEEFGGTRHDLHVGTGSFDPKEDSGTTTASQSGTTVTISGGSFTFDAADTERVIVWDTGEHAFITTYTDASNVEVDRSQTVASGEFTIMHTDVTALTAQIYADDKDGGFNVDGVDKDFSVAEDTGNNRLIGTSIHTRVYTHSGASTTVREIGMSPVDNTTLTVFDRIRDGSGNPTAINLDDGDQLKVVHTLTMYAEPWGAVSKTITITGFAAATGAADDSVDGTVSLCVDSAIASYYVDVYTDILVPTSTSNMNAYARNVDDAGYDRVFSGIASNFTLGTRYSLGSYTANSRTRSVTRGFSTAQGNINIYIFGVTCVFENAGFLFRHTDADAGWLKENVENFDFTYTVTWDWDFS